MNPITKPVNYPEIVRLCQDELFITLGGIDHSLFNSLNSVFIVAKELKQKLEIVSNQRNELSSANRIFNVLASQTDKDEIRRQLNSLEDSITKIKQDYSKNGLENNRISNLIIETINKDDDLYVKVRTLLNPNWRSNNQGIITKPKQECPYVKVTHKQRRLDNTVRVTRLYKKYLKSIERKTTFDFLLGITYIDSLDIKKMIEDNK